jgi:glycosyltransferase involved in cell wall biosynthesis
MKPRKLLFVTDAFPPHTYGSGWSTYHLARALRDRGHEVRIVVAQPTRECTLTHYDDFVVWRPPPDADTIHDAIFAVTGLAAGKRVRDIVASWHPDVIHAQHVHAALVVSHLLRRPPVVITVRDHWPICYYGTARTTVRCPHCMVGTRSPCNPGRGTREASVLPHAGKAALMSVALAQRRRVLHRADAVVAVSQAIAAEVASVVLLGKLHTIPNGIEPLVARDATLPPDVNLPPAYLLYVGKLNVHKGANLLPAILQRLPTDAPPLVVVGDGPEERALRAVEHQGVHLLLLGVRRNAEVLALMKGATALLFPAQWDEPLSRTLIEALAMGCPVVATATGGTAEIVRDTQTGFLVAHDDLDAFAHRLMQIVGDPALRDRMAMASCAHADTVFNIEVVAARMEALYSTLCKTRY